MINNKLTFLTFSPICINTNVHTIQRTIERVTVWCCMTFKKRHDMQFMIMIKPRHGYVVIGKGSCSEIVPKCNSAWTKAVRTKLNYIWNI